MDDVKLRQDNRITMARYELSLIEKRVMYFILKEIRKQFVLTEGQRNLFNDLIVTIDSAKLTKEVLNEQPERVKQALKSLRLRSFEYDNGEPEDSYEHHWFEVGFINWAQWNKGGAIEVQISKLILPFYVELTEQYTEYSLVVAMSLRSKWSQRMYELCSQWRVAGGFRLKIDELKKMFSLDGEYERFASLKSRVLEKARLELKKLYDENQCDLYFNYSEEKKGRSIDGLRFKIISRESPETSLSLMDIDYQVRTELHSLFQTKNYPKNDEYVKRVLAFLRLHPDELKKLNIKILYVKQHIPKDEQAKYLRFVINEDYLKI